MRKTKNLIVEGAQFPIASLLFAMLLIGIGTAFNSDNQYINLFLNICTYIGGIIKQLFPITLIVCILGKLNKPAMAIISGIVAYFVVLIITMYLCDQSYESYFYQNFLGLNVNITSFITNESVTHYPINIGYIGAIAVIIVVKNIYTKVNTRSNYSILSFISNDAICLIYCVLAAVILGLLFSFLFKYFVLGITALMSYISEYSTRFRGMFVYEATERILDILGFSDIYRNAFWFNSAGGNWADAYGKVYNGDINVWAAQIKSGSIELGFGKYITPYYAINLFVMPTIALLYYVKTQNKIDRHKNFGLILVTIIISLISSSQLPLELALFLTTPLLTAGHVVISGFVGAALFKLNIQIGYAFSGNVLYALPGSLIAFINNGIYAIEKNAFLYECIVGVIASVLYSIMFMVYYRFFAFKPFNRGKRKILINQIEASLGGIKNIQYITSGALGIHFVAYNDDLVDFEKLFMMNFYDIKAVRYGYQMYYGAESLMIVKMIKKDMAQIEHKAEE